MSDLYDFLNPVVENEEKEVVISDRFVKRGEDGTPILDEDGKMIPRPFKIRALTQEENDSLIRAATTSYKDRTGNKVNSFDRFKYSHSVVITGTVDPDFKSKELCDKFGVLDPELAVAKMLRAGEYQKLADAIAELSGIGDDVEDEAKN